MQPWRNAACSNFRARKCAYEQLEKRQVFSVYYDYSLIAQSGVGLGSILSSASINDSGDVAFVAGNAAGHQSIYAGQGTAAASIVSFPTPSAERMYGGDVQINNSGQVSAADVLGAQRRARIWNVNMPGTNTIIAASSIPRADTSHFDSMGNFTSISNDGQLAFAGLENPGSNDPAFWEVQLDDTLVDRRDVFSPTTQVVELVTPPSPFFRFKAANGDRVVVANRQNNQTGITLYDITGIDSSDVLATTTSSWTELGIRPGISDDGSVVAFVGTQGAARGVYVSFLDEQGVRKTELVVGLNQGVPLGYDASGAPIHFGDLDLDGRLGVEIYHKQGGSSDRFESGESMIVSFVGTPNSASKNNPVTNSPFLFSNQRGLWTIKLDANTKRATGLPPVSYTQSSATPVVQVGDVISGHIITDFGVNDPLAKVSAAQTGAVDHQLAFWAKAGTTDLIVRARQQDMDGDGLFNHWEQSGIDIDQDGVIDLNLNGMSANPLRKDIFLEIDWLANNPSNGRSYAPQSGALDELVTAFAAAPLANPDGSTGIVVHIDAGAGLSKNMGGSPGGLQGGDLISQAGTGAHIDGIFFGPSSVTVPGAVVRSMDDIKDNYFGTTTKRAREFAFRYTVFGDRLAGYTSTGWALIGASGQAELGEFGGTSDQTFAGNDMLVTLGTFPSVQTTVKSPAGATVAVPSHFLQSQTLIHELGHTLGLRHGGNNDQTSPPSNYPTHVAGDYKPSYRSVMNYAYQFDPDSIGNLIRTFSGASDSIYNDWANLKLDFVRYFDTINNSLGLTARGLSTPPPLEEPQITAAAFAEAQTRAAAIDPDFDGNNKVDGADFLAWQRGFGTSSGATRSQGDADGNGAVEQADLAVWMGRFGEAAASDSIAIPSTATLAQNTVNRSDASRSTILQFATGGRWTPLLKWQGDFPTKVNAGSVQHGRHRYGEVEREIIANDALLETKPRVAEASSAMFKDFDDELVNHSVADIEVYDAAFGMIADFKE